jgi:para-nitrobenzyl esterase
MRALLLAAALGTGGLAAAPLAVAAPAAAPAYSTSTSTIGELVDNPQTRPIFEKYLPGISTNDQFAMARPMTLRQVQSYAPDMFTDEKLAKIDAELAKLPAKK